MKKLDFILTHISSLNNGCLNQYCNTPELASYHIIECRATKREKVRFYPNPILKPNFDGLDMKKPKSILT